MTGTGDLRRLIDLREELGGEVIIELVELFLEDTPEQLKAMNNAISSDNSEALKRSAHSLKGSAGNLGLPISQFAAKLEQYAANTGVDESQKLYDDLVQEFERLKVVLNNYLAEQKE